MKRYGLLLLSVCCWLAASGCKSATLEEEFAKTHKRQGQSILHRGEAGDKTFALYRSPFDNGQEGLGLAVFRHNEREGWKLLSSHAKAAEMPVTVDMTGIDQEDGSRPYLVYGYIRDPDIDRIELTDSEGRTVEANILLPEWHRIWHAFLEMEKLQMKAYNRYGELEMEVPSRSPGAYRYEPAVLQRRQPDGTYRELREIGAFEGERLASLYKLLHDADWRDAEALMERKPDYRLSFRVEEPAEHRVYAMWITPRGDKLELAIEGRRKRAMLQEKETAELRRLLELDAADRPAP
ncbi:hypothetical protein [Gorillibacterium sp. sgz5001074]|uniref:hypothetical protein n=1 Tax=Gorillibacterium sp. sgz5001074 TaxID=3446695 RepID=UPI003F667677